jgi:predicted nucleotidyltransferase
MNYDDVIEKLRRYAKSMAETHKGVKSIVLTGSLAKGNYSATSDADILVIADDLPLQLLDRHVLFADSAIPVDLEPRAYTPDEFVAMVKQGDHFATEALRIGKPLYGDQYFSDLKRLVEYEP